MEWIVTTARSVEEAETRALDLLGVDLDDAEVQIIEEGKTGLFGRTKAEARVRARIKPKAPPVKEERRQGRNNDRNRNRNRSQGNRSGGGSNRGGGQGGNRNRGGQGESRSKGSDNKSRASENKPKSSDGNSNSNRRRSGGNGGSVETTQSGAGGAGERKRGSNSNNANRGGRRGGSDRGRDDGGEDRVEMPIDEQRDTLEAFVRGVAEVFDDTSSVTMVEQDTTLRAEVRGTDLGRLIGNRASTLQTLEELARTAMHRAAAGRRYHRIQVDVDDYRARRRDALTNFAVNLAESVAADGESKAMEPMSAADRKLVHDAVGQIGGVETRSEGRDPRRYIVILPVDGHDEEE